MKQNTWKYARVGLVAVALVGALVSCNSHLLLKSGEPEVVVIDPPPVPPPPPVVTTDAGLPVIVFTTVTLGDLPDGATPDEPPPPPPGTDAAVVVIGPDAAKTPDLGPDLPPPETLVCPAGYVRMHVRDLWSSGVTPTMNSMTAPPLGVVVIDPTGSYMSYGARIDGTTDINGNPPCTYYSVCIPNTVAAIQIKPIGFDACPGTASGNFDISSVNKSKEFWMEYTGQSSSLKTDYSNYPNVPIGSGKFHLTSDSGTLTATAPACKIGPPPDATAPSGFTKVHFRWPWNDPTNPQTPYPGSGCGADKLGFSVPPYPSSLTVRGLGNCDMQAVLEDQDGVCPWYYVMIPNSDWPTTGNMPSITFRYPDESKGLYTQGLTLPARTASEYWIAYAGAPDNTMASQPKCQDWSLQTNSYFIYAANPGPGYQGCGGGASTATDPCSPPQPNGYHSVHFRYIWAGQKTFTFFPKPAFMPKWIEMEVNGTTATKVICWREQDRPWFNCPVPDALFTAGATWRAVDKLHSPEWNTVAPRPFPDTPKEYWLRWYYGKPDIPRTTGPPNFKFYDYYPDGTNGDWSATGVWNDSMCAPKPPASPVTVGFGNGAWFPYSKTQYKYPYGGSLAYIFPNSSTVQDLFNAFVWERYQIWKQNYLETSDTVCGAGTARVRTDPPKTVSEGQGYGMAISAAIGDKTTFDALWKFARHFLSQAAKKYCGGLMGWMWDGSIACRPLDTPCDPDTGGCGGNQDSAFDGDVDIGIGLVFAALQWPEYQQNAIDWLVKMECEINTVYDGKWNYPTNGDTWNKTDCSGYDITKPATSRACTYVKGSASDVFLDYFPPGYFRVFGDFLAAKVGSTQTAANGQTHRDFWYKTAETVYELYERCYDQAGVNPGMVGDSGNIEKPCTVTNSGTYEGLRQLWRTGIDAAWFGNNNSLPENTTNSSPHYGPKSRMQAKIDNTQEFFNNFYKKNPVVTNANRFSSICDQLHSDGTVTNCDPAYGHNSYTVNTAMCNYVSMFDDGKATTSDIRREAIEEAITTTVQNDRYFQESLGVYTILFLTGNFPNPLTVPAN